MQLMLQQHFLCIFRKGQKSWGVIQASTCKHTFKYILTRMYLDVYVCAKVYSCLPLPRHKMENDLKLQQRSFSVCLRSPCASVFNYIQTYLSISVCVCTYVGVFVSATLKLFVDVLVLFMLVQMMCCHFTNAHDDINCNEMYTMYAHQRYNNLPLAQTHSMYIHMYIYMISIFSNSRRSSQR